MKLTKNHREGLATQGRGMLQEHPRTNVAICHYDNLECGSLAREIEGLLVLAGWSRNIRPLVKVHVLAEGFPEDAGITVADEPPAEAQRLFKMLKDAGFDAKVRHVSERQSRGRYVGDAEVMLEIWPEA